MSVSYFTYILYSKRLDRFYVGHTSDIKERMNYHNGGHEAYTRNGVPWELWWMWTNKDKSAAIKLELRIKNLSRQRKCNLMEKYAVGLQISVAELKRFEP